MKNHVSQVLKDKVNNYIDNGKNARYIVTQLIQEGYDFFDSQEAVTEVLWEREERV